MVRAVRVDRAAVGRTHAGQTGGELIHVGLADQHRAGILQALHHTRRRVRTMGKLRTPRARAHPGDVHVVLHGEGNGIERELAACVGWQVRQEPRPLANGVRWNRLDPYRIGAVVFELADHFVGQGQRIELPLSERRRQRANRGGGLRRTDWHLAQARFRSRPAQRQDCYRGTRWFASGARHRRTDQRSLLPARTAYFFSSALIVSSRKISAAVVLPLM